MEDFYLVLPSNTSTGIFDNTTGEYELPLPKAFEFGDVKYEVALKEVSFPHTWENVRSPFLQVTFAVGGAAHPLEIEHGYYEKVEDLLEAINAIRPRAFCGQLSVSRQNKRVKLYLHAGEAIHFHEEMARMLGFSDSLMQNVEAGERLLFIADQMPDFFSEHIYVYTNIVMETLIGNEWRPFLCLISGESDHGTTVFKKFENPLYLNLCSNRIASIGIRLCDEGGEAIGFMSGTVICKLHFRRKNVW